VHYTGVDGRILSFWDRVDSASACMAFGNTIHTVHMGGNPRVANDEYELILVLYHTFVRFTNFRCLIT